MAGHAYRRRACVIAAVITLFCGAGGCSRALTGDWHLVKCAPNRETFAIDDAKFTRDGEYTATFALDGRKFEEQGRYHFNGFKLTFRPRGGGQREYNATLRINRLEIHDGKRFAILNK